MTSIMEPHSLTLWHTNHSAASYAGRRKYENIIKLNKETGFSRQDWLTMGGVDLGVFKKMPCRSVSLRKSTPVSPRNTTCISNSGFQNDIPTFEAMLKLLRHM